MGSPTNELGHSDAESPQHTVTIQPFFMGKYPVTQAQWQAVAALPQVNRELNPDPSYFKGANRPLTFHGMWKRNMVRDLAPRTEPMNLR